MGMVFTWVHIKSTSKEQVGWPRMMNLDDGSSESMQYLELSSLSQCQMFSASTRSRDIDRLLWLLGLYGRTWRNHQDVVTKDLAAFDSLNLHSIDANRSDFASLYLPVVHNHLVLLTFRERLLSSQVTIIYIMLFTTQIVSKQLYSIKQENSAS